MFGRLRLRRMSIAIVFVALAMIMTMGTAFARYGPPPGSGGGSGHGGGGEETVTNNLSVPTIMVSGGFTGVNCPSGTPAALVPPSGNPTYFETADIPGYYYVQGTNTWQAQCYTSTAASATAAWGDNLIGEARKAVGHPIRVELGLFNDGTSPSSVTTMDGYTVVKLNPDALDRESPYGTLAQSSTGPATPTAFAPTAWRVYDAGATFSIQNDTTKAYVVPVGTAATAEINATGNVVYGYNLRVSEAGKYTITFNIPTVTISGTNGGSFAAHSVSLTITVTTGSGGGRGGRGGGGGNG